MDNTEQVGPWTWKAGSGALVNAWLGTAVVVADPEEVAPPIIVLSALLVKCNNFR